jgi:hypothetical protein
MGSPTLLAQGNLRDKPLVDLTLPLLFVRGSKDSMCKAATFAAVKARMSSADLQVSLMALLRFDEHAEREINNDSLVQCFHLQPQIERCKMVLAYTRQQLASASNICMSALVSSIMCKRRSMKTCPSTGA